MTTPPVTTSAPVSLCEMIVDVSMDGDNMRECGKPAQWMLDDVPTCEECKVACADGDLSYCRRCGKCNDDQDCACDYAMAMFVALANFARRHGGHSCPDDIRDLGWSVAVHNDYRLDGKSHTFWLFTKGDRAVKGEGRNDADALDAVRAALAAKGE